MPVDKLGIPAWPTIVVWVEDPLTRAYLRAVWGANTRVAFRVGGGNDGVRAIVRTLEEEGHINVFGVTDRDFRPTNRSDWLVETKTFRVFVLPVHEVENYLIDAQALQHAPYQNRGLDADAIESRVVAAAGRLCWWAACRDVIAELKRRFRESFILDPNQSVADETSARSHICESTWFEKLEREANRTTVAAISQLLSESHQAASGRLADGTWRQDFAGKEILRDVAGWMCDRTKVVRFPKPDAVFYSDLAKSIGDWQANNNCVPTDLTDLLAALTARINRTSGP